MQTASPLQAAPEAAPEAAAEAGDPSAPLRRRTYVLLRQMIADGRLQAGERLLEAQVAKAFGVSRSPARHALQLLCAEKLVEALDGRGYRVAGGPGAELADRPATLDPVRIVAPPQWQRMYQEVEQELFIRVLFGSVGINEMRLAQHFAVSRTVTRDLLARMHGVGLIAKDAAGHWVASRVTPERIRHLYEMRWLLEPQALRHAAPHIPAARLDQARGNLVAALACSPPESAAFDRIEMDLHVDLLSFCPNREILRALARTHLLFGPTRYLFDPFLGIPVALIEAAMHEHLAIIDRLLAGDVEGAADGLRQHLQVAGDRWLKRFEITARMTQLQFPPYLVPVEDPPEAGPGIGRDGS